MASSLAAGQIMTQHDDFTLADGTDVATPGDLTFEICRNLVDEVVLVNEMDIARAMKDLMQRTKVVAEGAGALPTAALEAHKIDDYWVKNKKVVALVSGGNVDLARLAGVMGKFC
jgi:threonine dehydratase